MPENVAKRLSAAVTSEASPFHDHLSSDEDLPPPPSPPFTSIDDGGSAFRLEMCPENVESKPVNGKEKGKSEKSRSRSTTTTKSTLRKKSAYSDSTRCTGKTPESEREETNTCRHTASGSVEICAEPHMAPAAAQTRKSTKSPSSGNNGKGEKKSDRHAAQSPSGSPASEVHSDAEQTLRVEQVR